MAVTLIGAGGLFTTLGKIIFAEDTINTARGTTIQAEIEDAQDEFDNYANTLEFKEVLEGFNESQITYRDDDTPVIASRLLGNNLIVKLVNDDVRQPNDSLGNAMLELRTQMEGAGGETNPDDDVNASTAAVSVAAGSFNTGDGVVAVDITLGSGRNAENAYGEVIAGIIVDVTGTTISFAGEAVARSLLAAEWPQGSGSTVSFTGVSGGLLSNGGMDDEDDRANTPDGWVVEVGTIGTTVLMSDYEVQTVIMSGTPTSGTYTLTYTSVDSDEQTTEPIVFNATQSQVQSALRALKGLGAITVVTTGTTPDFTHTITFNEMDPPGDIGLLTSAEETDSGSLAHAEVTAGTVHVYKDKALIIDSNGAELTAIRQDVTASLLPRAAYCFNAYMKVDAFPAAGVITVRLVDGAGSVINNVQGVANSFTINPLSGQDLSTSAFTAVNGWFQTPTVIPEVVYLEIKTTTAISNTASLFIDEVTLVAGQPFYVGGPNVAVFSGQTPFGVRNTWDVTVTNDRAGKFQEAFFRNGYSRGTFLLPSDDAGGETINDNLIA